MTSRERAAFARAARWLRWRISKWRETEATMLVRHLCIVSSGGCRCAEIAESLSLDGMAVRG